MSVENTQSKQDPLYPPPRVMEIKSKQVVPD